MLGFLRQLSPHLDQCQLTFIQRSTIDLKRAHKQHDAFVRVLQDIGVEIEMWPELPDQPDGVFVEDTAVVLPELAVITRSASSSRRPATDSAASALARYRPIVRFVEPACLDGSDVLRIGKTLYVGQSQRTNADGIALLAETVEPFGYEVQPVELNGCVHLKGACTFIPPRFVVLNSAWVSPTPFRNLRVIEVDAAEPGAANTLTIDGITLVSDAFPNTARALHDHGIVTRAVNVGEFHKAEAGLSSLVLLLEPRAVRPSAPTSDLQIVSGVKNGTNGLFAPAVVHGGVVYVSGQLPLDPASGEPVSGDVELQAEQALRNLASVLTISGSSLNRLLRVTCYLGDIKVAPKVEAVCAKMLNGHRPAGSIVAAKTLRPGCALAIDAIAAIDDKN